MKVVDAFSRAPLSRLSILRRRQQNQDCEVWCSCSPHSVSTFEGHARPTQCDWRTPEHDAFRCAFHDFGSSANFVLIDATDENRQQLVNAGAIPVLVSLLNSPDTDVQYYCTTALSNIAVDGNVHVNLAAPYELINL